MSRDEERAGAASASQRLDKWLWFARMTKTRTLAADLVLSGKVRINRVRVVKPNQAVRVDHVLTVVLSRRVRVFRVLGLGIRRGPSATALALYEELTPEAGPPKRLTQTGLHDRSEYPNKVGPGQRAPGAGRPTKKERREIDRMYEKTR